MNVTQGLQRIDHVQGDSAQKWPKGSSAQKQFGDRCVYTYLKNTDVGANGFDGDNRRSKLGKAAWPSSKKPTHPMLAVTPEQHPGPLRARPRSPWSGCEPCKGVGKKLDMAMQADPQASGAQLHHQSTGLIACRNSATQHVEVCVIMHVVTCTPKTATTLGWRLNQMLLPIQNFCVDLARCSWASMLASVASSCPFPAKLRS